MLLRRVAVSPQRGASSGAGAFTLATLGAAAIADWSADDHGTANMTDDGAGAISAWADRLGGVSVTAATTARPTYGATAFNGKPGLTFDGTANCMVTTALGSIPTGANPSYIFAVLDTANVALTMRPLGWGAGVSGQDRRLTLSTAHLFQVSDGTTAMADASASAVGKSLLTGLFDGALLRGFVNGQPFSIPPVSLVPATGSTRLRIGASAAVSPASFFQGVIRRVVITGALSAAQRQQVEGYLAWDGGISNLLARNHPYRSIRP